MGNVALLFSAASKQKPVPVMSRWLSKMHVDLGSSRPMASALDWPSTSIVHTVHTTMSHTHRLQICRKVTWPFVGSLPTWGWLQNQDISSTWRLWCMHKAGRTRQDAYDGMHMCRMHMLQTGRSLAIASASNHIYLTQTMTRHVELVAWECRRGSDRGGG